MQPESQRKVTEVVGGELHLPPLRRVLLGQGHDPGIVDQHVQRPAPTRGERGHRRQIGQVEPLDAELPVARGGRNLGGDLRPSVCVAHGERDVGTGSGERPRRPHADA